MSESTDIDEISAASLVLTAPIPITEHPAAVYLSSLSPGSRPAMGQALDAIAQILTSNQCDALTLDWAELRYKHTATLRSILMERYAPATANKMLSALRRVLREALRLELMDARDFERAVDIANIKVSKELQGRYLSADEIDALMQVCFSDPTPIGYRDAALIAILRGAGLRRGEAVNLNLSDLHSGSIKIRNGKGGKDRTVYLPNGALSIVEDWLEIRGPEAGALICRINKAGAVTLRQLTPQAVLFILQKRGTEAGVENFSAHDFRRTFISELLDSTDIVTVQKLAGHASPELTSRYDRRGEEVKQRAVQSIIVPKRK
ncbi:tyrosine-type recombinase/integrase [Anabaena cylindrica FACHB-243]|uniref:Integrase family protein n=1 Tax=Anabaena cylindrica (strain ATCC 27899 / PCC 7122) TaxID=272123 RepID=K9ZSD7_ANACC|nr:MULTISPECIES: tyrosine-type recombinase/integrase [Anabaena]AFZ61265.1 integrase family protein [Anabaena cylindrica PCC 7122]MBD2418238.1 tyrosine-type recombinase/integrase [Anabaena cylindrica FACHB-243]MBY5285217.1 tyrosine-type recombinase/integrase [Anabaena sp. CCAP 1446/1C]MBY5311220.1 tyrosine-type recombinase/integrase [Anabaena sp. CCAP 1446/1C]MCM2409307.1 site-specific integrase [Anabaena sp. CCAP 1446/1C]